MVRGFESLERYGMLVVSKDRKGGRYSKRQGRETVSGGRTEGKEKVEQAVFFFIPPQNPGPIFFNYIPKKGKNPFLDSS